MSNIEDFTKRRLDKEPVQYTVVFRHDGEGMSFVVHDIQDSERDRLAVARDLEIAAESLRNHTTSCCSEDLCPPPVSIVGPFCLLAEPVRPSP